MAYRQELKYIVSAADRELLIRRLGAVLRRDPYAMPDGTYAVRTLYFDDLYATAMGDALSGAPLRQKYRLRMYNLDPSFLRLEQKIKRYGGGTKPGVLLSPKECALLLRGDCAFLAEREEAFCRAAYAAARAGKLRPASLIQYTRTAFCDGRGDLRVTVDSDIRVSSRTDAFFSPVFAGMPVMEHGECVLEVKFDHFLPDHLSRLLGIGDRPRTAMSKFAAGRLYD